VVGRRRSQPKTVRVAFDEPVLVGRLRRSSVDAEGRAGRPRRGHRASAIEGSVALLTLDTEMTPDVAPRGRGASASTDLPATSCSRPTTARRSAGFRPARPATRRFDLWRMLPKHHRRERSTPGTSSGSSPACRR
jgi:hypothetical protein